MLMSSARRPISHKKVAGIFSNNLMPTLSCFVILNVLFASFAYQNNNNNNNNN